MNNWLETFGDYGRVPFSSLFPLFFSSAVFVELTLGSLCARSDLSSRAVHPVRPALSSLSLEMFPLID